MRAAWHERQATWACSARGSIRTTQTDSASSSLDDSGVPAGDRILAALSPKTLSLAAARSAGAHPYLTTPAHTRAAREILGPGPLLAPEHKVVVSADPVHARSIGRPMVRDPYLSLRNYEQHAARGVQPRRHRRRRQRQADRLP